MTRTTPVSLLLLLAAATGCNSTSSTAPVITTPAAPITATNFNPADQPSTAPAPAAAISAEPASNLAHFRDPGTKVSLDYPNIWSTSSRSPAYLGGQIPPSYGQPVFVASFSPVGNLYQKTVLTSLVFIFSTKTVPSAASCAAGLQASAPASPTPAAYNGVSYQEYSTGDAGMCHEQQATVDIAYRKDLRRCFAFERDFNTECFGAGDNKRRLTPQETQALQHHLDAIMQSVQVHF
jgi:hypothetical protein